VNATRANGEHARGVSIAPGHSALLRLAPGSWDVCGHQPATARFASYDRCISILVTGVPSLRIGAPRVTGQAVGFQLHYSAVLRGRKATLTITPLSAHCTTSHTTCTASAGKPSSRKLVLRMKVLTLPLPAVGHGFRLTLATSAFQVEDAPWTAARATSRPFIRD